MNDKTLHYKTKKLASQGMTGFFITVIALINILSHQTQNVSLKKAQQIKGVVLSIQTTAKGYYLAIKPLNKWQQHTTLNRFISQQ